MFVSGRLDEVMFSALISTFCNSLPTQSLVIVLIAMTEVFVVGSSPVLRIATQVGVGPQVSS